MAKECEACGAELSFRNSFQFQGSAVCRNCLNKLEAGEEIAAFTPKKGIVTKTQSSSPPLAASYQFKTLLGYGKFISGLGWIVIIVGILAIFGGIASGDRIGFSAAGGGLLFILVGLGSVASGQLISCFVSIERNTRATYETLRK